MDYFKKPFNVIGLCLVVLGVLGVLNVLRTDTLSAGGAGFSFQGHGAWGLVALGLFLCENPLTQWLLNRKTPPTT